MLLDGPKQILKNFRKCGKLSWLHLLNDTLRSKTKQLKCLCACLRTTHAFVFWFGGRRWEYPSPYPKQNVKVVCLRTYGNFIFLFSVARCLFWVGWKILPVLYAQYWKRSAWVVPMHAYWHFIFLSQGVVEHGESRKIISHMFSFFSNSGPQWYAIRLRIFQISNSFQIGSSKFRFYYLLDYYYLSVNYLIY